MARYLRTALIVAFAIACADAGALPAEPGQRFAGATDGVWYWVLPETPGGTRPIQSWSGAGAGPADGEIYVAGMDHATNSALYRLRGRRRDTPRDRRCATSATPAPPRGRSGTGCPARSPRSSTRGRPGTARGSTSRTSATRPRRRLPAAARLSLVRVRPRRGLLQRPQRERAGRGRRAAGRHRQHRRRRGPEPDLRRQPADRRPLRPRRRAPAARRSSGDPTTGGPTSTWAGRCGSTGWAPLPDRRQPGHAGRPVAALTIRRSSTTCATTTPRPAASGSCRAGSSQDRAAIDAARCFPAAGVCYLSDKRATSTASRPDGATGAELDARREHRPGERGRPGCPRSRRSRDKGLPADHQGQVLRHGPVQRSDQPAPRPLRARAGISAACSSTATTRGTGTGGSTSPRSADPRRPSTPAWSRSTPPASWRLPRPGPDGNAVWPPRRPGMDGSREPLCLRVRGSGRASQRALVRPKTMRCAHVAGPSPHPGPDPEGVVGAILAAAARGARRSGVRARLGIAAPDKVAEHSIAARQRQLRPGGFHLTNAGVSRPPLQW